MTNILTNQLNNNLNVNGDVKASNIISSKGNLNDTIDKTQNQTATENETTFTGNVTADTFNGYNLGMNKKFYDIPSIPVIGTDLVMEVGRYIDFHTNPSTDIDNKARLHISKLGTLYFDHSFIVEGGDIKARNCISDNGNLHDAINKIVALETKNTEQDGRLDTIETKNTEQGTRLDTIETKNTEQDTRLDNLESKDTAHEERLGSIEAMDTAQNETINNINTKNTEQDESLDELYKNKLSVTYKAGSVAPNITHEFTPELSEERTDVFNIKINITFEEKTYFPTFATGNNKLLYFEIKFYEIINGTQYTVVAGNTVFAINENGNVTLSGDNTHYIMNNFIIEKGKISLDMSYKSPNHTEPSMWHGWFSTESTIYYQNAVLSQPTINEYFISKNLAHDNEERLTAATNKNTEQDGRLDVLEDSKLTVVHYSTNASINVVCLDGLDEYIYRPRFKVSIIFEDSEYYPTFTSENTLLASYVVKLKIINNNTLYTLKKNIYSREVDGKVEISGSNMIILDWVIQKGRIDINLTDDGSQPVIILGINDQNYYPNALIQYPVVDNYLVSKNLAHDNEERLTAATNKNTEQDERLNVIESELPNKSNVGHKHVFNDITDLKTLSTKALFDRMYPTGSIYMSYTKQPPPFGQWELLEEGYFLQSTTTTSGKKGGTATHTHTTGDHVLTESEMPNHNHIFNGDKITGTVYDIMQYDSNGQTNKEPEGAFSVNRYGSRTWTGKDGNNRAFSLTFEATPSGSISNTGNNQPHNHGDTSEASNVPPYITVYIYKRVDDTSTTIEIPDVVTTVNDTVDLTGYVKHEELAEIETTIESKNNEQDEKLNVIESELPNKANVSHTHTVSDVTDLKTLSTKALFDRMYPTGSIYISFTKQPPPFGQWELLEEGYFLQSTATTSGKKGGTATHTHTTADHTLTIDEMPAHGHDIRGGYGKGGNDIGRWRNDLNSPANPWGNCYNTGGGQPHNHGDTGSAENIPPYITVYIYKRVDDTSTTIEIPDVITTVNDTVDLTGYVKHEEVAEIKNELSNKANVSHTHTVSDVTDLKTLSTKALFDRMYPTGSIYMTFNPSPPIFGTWELISDGYFLQSTTTSPGETGGSSTHTHTTADHTLTVDEIPSHIHSLRGYGMKLGSGSSAYRFGGNGSELADNVVTSTGGSKAHNHGNTGSSSNIPPYIKCYMYKRTDDTSTTTDIPDEITTINDATIDLTNYVKHEELTVVENKIETKNNEQDGRLNTIENELPNKANVSHTHTISDVTDIKTLSTKALFDRIYPTGSIYVSFTKQPPPIGQWELLEEGRFLRSVTTTSGGTGGSTTHTHTTGDHTLTIAEIPSHNHGQRVTSNASSTYSGLRKDFDEDAPEGMGYYEYDQGVNTKNTGGGKAHNHGDTGSSSNIPPYINVFIYKRIDDTSATTDIPDEINAIDDTTIDLTNYVKREELADYAKITFDEVNGLKVLDIGNSSIMAITDDATNSGLEIVNKVEGNTYGLLSTASYKDENNNLKHHFNLNGETFVDGNLQVFNGDISINGEPLSSKFAAITTDESGYKNLNIGDVFIKNFKDDTTSDIAIGIKKTDGEVTLFHSDTSGTNKTIYVNDDLNVFNNLHVNGTITAPNVNVTSITTNTINGMYFNTETSPTKTPFIPVVKGSAVMEVGRIIDFHTYVADGEISGTDYDCRLYWNNNGNDKLTCSKTFTAPSIEATSITTNTINGYPIKATLNGTTESIIPVIRDDGILEVRNYIDFHYLDYSSYCRLKYDNEKLQCSKTFTAPSIEATSIITKRIDISDSDITTNVWNHLMSIYAPNMENGAHALINIGKGNRDNHSGHFGFKYSTSGSAFVIGLYGRNDMLLLTRNKLTSTVPITAPNISASFTVTHETGSSDTTLTPGTFCETDGTIYEKYKDNIKPDDCICNIKQSKELNKNIIGVTISTDPIKFATHGDVLIKVVNDTYNVGDILVPGEGGYGKKPTGDELMTCLLNKIPTAKITSLETGIDNEVACML